ncbi:MAG: LCP family protein [Culicoidibacterales bacterium]
MSQQFQESRTFRKRMQAEGYVYNEATKQYEQIPPEAKRQSPVDKKKRGTKQSPQSIRSEQRNRKAKKHSKPKTSKRRRLRWPNIRIKPAIFAILAIFLLVTTVFDSAFWRGGQAYSVLFVGVDTSQQRDDWKGDQYADAIIYATIEPWKQQIRILPINRDLSTTLTCTKTTANINHAYNQGGMSCLQKTVEKSLGLPVDYYVETNFNGFVEVIDALGGLSVTAEKSFCEQNAQDESDAICFEANQTYQMSGEQALAYARHRKSDNLAGRQRRQEQVLQAVIQQAFRPQTIIRYPLVIATVVKNVATNLTPYGLVLTGLALVQHPEKITYDYQGSYEVTDNYHFYPDNQFWQAVTELQEILK